MGTAPAKQPEDRPPESRPPESRPPESRPIEAVQMLRGVAASLVVLYHIRVVINGAAYLDLGDRLFASGACGVDLFFAISGFIMVHVTASSACRGRDVAGFLIKRWARIWPLYVIATLVMFCCDPNLGFDQATAIDISKAFVFYPRRSTGAPFFGWAPLVTGWTLCYEVWFYLMFAASMAFRRHRWLALGVLFVVALVVTPLASGRSVVIDAYKDYELQPAILDIATSPMMWEFAAGAIIAAIYRSRFRIRSEFTLKLLMALSSTILFWQLFANSGRHGPLHWGVPAAFVLLSFVLAHKQMNLRIPAWLVWLGDISYSLYLVHRIVQLGLTRWLPALKLSRWTSGGAFFLGSTALAVIVAAISHRFLERGLSEWVRRKLMSRLIAPGPGVGSP